MNKEKEILLKRLNNETKEKNRAEIELIKSEQQLKMLKTTIKITKEFIKEKEKTIDEITNNLKESE